MSYGVIYRMEFTEVKTGFDCRLDILQKDHGSGFSIIRGTDSPVLLNSINNDESKFSAIRGQKLTANIIADGSFNIESMISESDDSFQCEFYRDETLVFKGFIVQDDCSEDYQDEPNVVVAEFMDNLGLLKDEALTDNSGNQYDGKVLLNDVIQSCLQKTLLDLPFRIYFNLFEVNMSETNGVFRQLSVDARTFKTSETAFMSCYEALELILVSSGCVLFQSNGKWIIYRIKDLQKRFVYYADYLPDGTPNGTNFHDFQAEIGGDRILPVNKDQIKSIVRPYKSAEVVFNYKPWMPLIRNVNLLEGDLVLPLSGPTLRAYTVPRWIITNGSFTPITPNFTYNTYAQIDALGREDFRYLALQRMVFVGSNEFISSERFPIKAGDTIDFSVDCRTSIEIGGTIFYNFNIFVCIVPTGGSSIDLKSMAPDPNNDNAAAWLDGYNDLSEAVAPSADDSTQWRTLGMKSAPIPFDGELFISIQAPIVGGPSVAYWYRNMKINYQVNGIVAGAIGHKWTASQDKAIKNKSNTETFLSDCTRPVLNGCLFREDGETLTEKWYERDKEDVELEFMEAHAVGIFNSQFRYLRKIEGSFYGLDNNEILVADSTRFTISLLDLFYILSLPNRYLIPLAITEIDFRNSTFKAILVEHRSDFDPVTTEENLNGDQLPSRQFDYIYESAG